MQHRQLARADLVEEVFGSRWTLAGIGKYNTVKYRAAHGGQGWQAGGGRKQGNAYLFVHRHRRGGSTGIDVPGNGNHGRVGGKFVGNRCATFRRSLIILGDQFKLETL